MPAPFLREGKKDHQTADSNFGRTPIGNAKVDGLQEDLHLTDGQYNATLTIFFVSYAVFEPLTNILLKKYRPSIFLPIIMVWWGICMTTMGLVHDFAGLMTAVSNLSNTRLIHRPWLSYVHLQAGDEL